MKRFRARVKDPLLAKDARNGAPPCVEFAHTSSREPGHPPMSSPEQRMDDAVGAPFLASFARSGGPSRIRENLESSRKSRATSQITRVGRTLLSAAFDFDFELNRVGPTVSQYCKKDQNQRPADRACPERSRRECPPHTSTSAATLQQQTSSHKGEDPHRHGGHHPRPKNRAVVRCLNKEVVQHMNKVQRQQ